MATVTLLQGSLIIVGWISRKQLDSGRGRTFFLTSILIELIDTEHPICAYGHENLTPSYNRATVKPSLSLKRIGIWTGAFDSQPGRKIQEAVAELSMVQRGRQARDIHPDYNK
jgi:hypothetical protein